MTQRLQPIVARRGFAVGTAPLRTSNIVYIVLLLLAFGGIVGGTMAVADVVHAITRSS